MPNQPVILVKKANGTTVRMSLDEAMKLKKNYSVALAPSEKGKKMEAEDTQKLEIRNIKMEKELEKEAEKKEPEKKNLPAIEDRHDLAIAAPVKNIFIDEARAKILPQSPEHLAINKNIPPKTDQPKIKQKTVPTEVEIKSKKVERAEPEKKPVRANLTKEDFVSPLEESFDHQSEIGGAEMPILPAKKSDLLDKILSKLTFSISKDLISRVESLAISFVKEIRNADQIKIYALRQAEEGGLGLIEGQANEFIGALREIKNFSQNLQTDKNKKKNRIDMAGQMPEIKQKGGSASIARNAQNSNVSRRMQDVTLPQTEDTQTISPIEELKMFDLKEFRRLDSNPQEAKEILLEKFSILKEDSYLLYLEGNKAWRENPLNQTYKKIIIQATEQKKTIGDILAANPDGMTMDELRVVMDINRELS